MVFGEKITSQRKKLGLSQQDLADKIGTHGAVIGKYERGEITPSVEVARKIADELGISLDFLTDETGESSPLQDKQILRRISELEKLPEKDREFAFQAIDMVIRDVKTRKAYAAG
jgi:transcriptional regulator with XRE-family HTH domain